MVDAGRLFLPLWGDVNSRMGTVQATDKSRKISFCCPQTSKPITEPLGAGCQRAFFESFISTALTASFCLQTGPGIKKRNVENHFCRASSCEILK